MVGHLLLLASLVLLVLLFVGCEWCCRSLFHRGQFHFSCLWSKSYSLMRTTLTQFVAEYCRHFRFRLPGWMSFPQLPKMTKRKLNSISLKSPCRSILSAVLAPGPWSFLGLFRPSLHLERDTFDSSVGWPARSRQPNHIRIPAAPPLSLIHI